MNYRENTQLQKLVSIFLEKNTHINLSAIRDEEGVWVKHIEDSLITLPLFEQFGDKKLKILDLGTGGGYPGLPLATMLPQHHFTLLDATRKKVDCVREFAESLGLTNVTAQWGRVEDMRAPSMKEERLHNKNGIIFLDGTPSTSDHYDLVVTRAAAYIEDLFTWIKPLLKADGRAWIYKQASEEEWADGQQLAKNRGMILTKALTYHLADQERWILEIRKK
ncbi:16S rRNA (guanine(527)-N(7))-methyltransferase RsmG [Candidatus Gracilibacteria bacterium]|nr:16S rRNA (guanine(527)-N(7))-methyltransferase RsmG [Candidatus Gracilibacteria bacterium]